MTPNPPAPQKVALDANVIINLLKMHCIEILPKLTQYQFVMPNHVWDEIHRRHERLRLRNVFKEGWLEEVEITKLPEIELYARYKVRFGAGESACLALACSRGWILASDEKAVKREVHLKLGIAQITDTKALLQDAVNKSILTEEKFKDLCAKFEF